MSHFFHAARRLGAFITAWLMVGCATFTPSVPPEVLWPTADAKACADWFAQLDAATDSAGVRDGSAYRVPGFANLRVDRFLASFRGELAGEGEAFGAWLERLAQLDQQAREAELSNLPPRFLPIAGIASKAAVWSQTQRCATVLASAVLASAAARGQLMQRAEVPDDYARWKRAVGLYPLTRILFFKGVEGWQKSAAQKFAQSGAALPQDLQLLNYVPASTPVAAERMAALHSRIKKDALGIPLLSQQDQALLLQAHAPLLEIETTGAYDRFGALHWADDKSRATAQANGSEAAPEVDHAQAVVYQRLAYTRYQGQTLLQLVYSVWFPERPPTTAVDWLSGQLDSVVLRVTLGSNGEPLLYDSIHSCGCYHMFFPTPRVTPRPAPQAGMEWAFVPATLPALSAGQRVVLRLASRTHYVVGLRAAMAGMPYTVMDDNALRVLPTATGGTRSAFLPSGIVPGTERAERLIFWPMGIDRPGAMRQWGRQPTAFVGRRHFDDANLLEPRFLISAP